MTMSAQRHHLNKLHRNYYVIRSVWNSAKRIDCNVQCKYSLRKYELIFLFYVISRAPALTHTHSHAQRLMLPVFAQNVFNWHSKIVACGSTGTALAHK